MESIFFFKFAALKCAHSETISVTCQNANFTEKIPHGVQFVMFYYMQCFTQNRERIRFGS